MGHVADKNKKKAMTAKVSSEIGMPIQGLPAPHFITQGEFNSLSRDVAEMKALMGKMVDAISRISILDDRQSSVAAVLVKVDERLARLEEAQHRAELSAARESVSPVRITNLESSVREMHVEREKDKARMQTIIWVVSGAWALVGALGGKALSLIADKF